MGVSFEQLKKEEIERQRREKLAMIRRERELQGNSAASTLLSTSKIEKKEVQEDTDKSIEQYIPKKEHHYTRTKPQELKLDEEDEKAIWFA